MSEEPTRFRPIRPGDLPVLRRIAAATWEGDDYLGEVAEGWIEGEGFFAGVLVGDRLAGCGRVLPLGRGLAWLEALRIDPDLRGLGLGRAMSDHLLGYCIDNGLRRLLFSTYFRNVETVRITEPAGFRRIATYTNLEHREIAEIAPPPPPSLPVIVREGLPEVDAMFWNDWFFAPAETVDRARFFPGATTLASGSARIALCDNLKFPGTIQEIFWIEGNDPACVRCCLLEAFRMARERGRRRLRLMAPSGTDLGPYLELGLRYFERSEDVFVYEGPAVRPAGQPPRGPRPTS